MTTTTNRIRREQGPATKSGIGTAGRDERGGLHRSPIIGGLKQLVTRIATKIRHFELCDASGLGTESECWMTFEEARSRNAELRRSGHQARWIVADELPVEGRVA